MSRKADSGSDERSDMFESNEPGSTSKLGDPGMSSDRSLPFNSLERRETLGNQISAIGIKRQMCDKRFSRASLVLEGSQRPPIGFRIRRWCLT